MVVLVLQFILIILAKIYFIKTVDQVYQLNNYFSHSIVIDQMQNIFLALVMVLSNIYVSFGSVVMLLFAVYTFSSLGFAQEPHIDPPFKITTLFSVFQYAISLILLMIILMLKCWNMWRTSSDESYEEVSISIGVTIGMISLSLIILNSLTTIVTMLIKICEIRSQNQNQDE